jgi:hypothetical protein
MRPPPRVLTTLDRVVLLLAGIPLALGGLGLTASFGLFAPIGIPLLIIGLGCISAATESSGYH